MNFITPVNVSPVTTGSFVDVDVSAHIPSGATGVILHLVNQDTGFASVCKIRKNGSTDDIDSYISADSHNWACIGVDGSRIFEAYIGSAIAEIYLVGYFMDEAVFFTNAVVKNADTDNVRKTISIASDTGADTAIAAIFFISDGSSPDTFGIRKTGSTDDRTQDADSGTGFIVGLDGSEQCDILTNDASEVNFNLVGYMTAGVVMNTNATDISLGGTGSWTDLSTLPTGALGALIEVFNSSADDVEYGLRKDGSSENLVLGLAGRHGFGIVEASSLVVEGQIGATSLDFFLMGYFVATVSPSSSVSPSVSPSSSTSPSGTPSPSVSPSSSLSPSASNSPSASVSPSSSVSLSLSPSSSASPSPSDYGIVVKKQSVNKDVEDITDPKELVFTSGKGVLGIHSNDTVSGTTDASGNINTTKNHGIGYTPIVLITTTAYDGNRVVFPAEWHSYYLNGSHELIEVTERFNAKIDGTKIRIVIHAEYYNHDLLSGGDLASRNYDCEVYYMFNELIETV